MKVGMWSKKPKTIFLGRYCMLQSWPDYSDPTVCVLEEVTVSTHNNFVSIVITYKSIIRIIFFNLSKTIPFAKSNTQSRAVSKSV